MSSKTKKVDPRIIRTRMLIGDAFVHLMSEKGYDSITVQDITERATLNRATFYLHYQDKEDLLLQMVDEMLSNLVNHKLPSHQGSNVQDFHPTAVRVFEHIAEHEEFFRLMLIKKGVPHFMSRMKKIIIDFYDPKVPEKQFDNSQLKVPKDIILNFIASAYIGTIVWWLENDMPYTSNFMANQLITLTRSGVFSTLGLNQSSHNT